MLNDDMSKLRDAIYGVRWEDRNESSSSPIEKKKPPWFAVAASEEGTAQLMCGRSEGDHIHI